MRGFTIIEVITAIFILAVGAVGVFALINQALVSVSILQSRLIASYLAQEGIEVVRNIRDSNWLSGSAWDTNIETGEREADYDDYNLLLADNYLNIDGDGFYSYSPGTATKFKRKITISEPEIDKIDVSVTVTWTERGRTHEFVTKGSLYNWK